MLKPFFLKLQVVKISDNFGKMGQESLFNQNFLR